MKKKLLWIFTILLVLGIVCTALIFIFKKPDDEDNKIKIESIGIGGGGAFYNPLVDPTNANNYYVTSDMGGLYYSYNMGKTWNRTESRGVFHSTHIDGDGTLFLGGYGLYASYDSGKTTNLIYPKNVKHSVSRCGWNENLMLAENYNNGMVRTICSYNNNIYFATLDWEYNLNIVTCDFYGNNATILYTKNLPGADPMSKSIHMYADSSGLYFTCDFDLYFINLTTMQTTIKYSFEGEINDFEYIDNKFFIIVDTKPHNKILYTDNFITFNDIMQYNTLTTSFTKYERNGTFNWNFIQLSGNNFNNIYLSLSAQVNEYYDMVEGILKFNGQAFEWVFDSVFKTKYTADINGWSYGSYGPFYGIYANPHDDDKCLVANIETVYDIKYVNENNREIVTLHCNDHNGSHSTNGLNCQTTYSVHRDPFNSDHIIICTTDMGLQNSYDNGKTWQRMEITGTVYDIYNTCYDLYFDTNTKGLVYGLWSSRHDAPYNPKFTDKGTTMGAFGISTDGGVTWDLTTSSGIPSDAIPVKFSVEKQGDNLVFAVATFNYGFFISYDNGNTFKSISENMEDVDGFIFGEDVVLNGNTVYCLTATIFESPYGKIASKLYEYNLISKTTKNIDLGEIIIARSLTFNKEKGLYINVIPNYRYEWFVEYNGGAFVNEIGGIYHYDGVNVVCVYENRDGIFNSKFDDNGNLYAVDTYGKVFIVKDDKLEIFMDGLFNMLKNVSILNGGKEIYITTFGGGTYKITLP